MELKKQIDVAKKFSEKKKLASADDFWARTGLVEVDLVVHIHVYLSGRRKTFSEKIHDELIREYQSAWKQYGSARQLNSIIEHYAFLVAVLRKNEEHASLCGELERILNSLKAMFEEAD